MISPKGYRYLIALHHANPRTPRKKNSSNTATKIPVAAAPIQTPAPGQPAQLLAPRKACPSATKTIRPIPNAPHPPIRQNRPIPSTRPIHLRGSSAQNLRRKGIRARATPIWTLPKILENGKTPGAISFTPSTTGYAKSPVRRTHNPRNPRIPTIPRFISLSCAPFGTYGQPFSLPPALLPDPLFD